MRLEQLSALGSKEKLERRLKEVLPLQSFDDDAFLEELPLVTWREHEAAPGCFTISLFCESPRVPEASAFFYEMVSRRFLPDGVTLILHAHHWPFAFSHIGGRSFYFGEIMVQAARDKQRSSILERLPIIAREIELGVMSAEHARRVLSQGELKSDRKLALVQRDLAHLHSRYPKRVTGEIYSELDHLLLANSAAFFAVRTSRHLSRLVGSFYIARKELLRSLRLFPKRRHLSIKLTRVQLNFAFGRNSVLGIALAVTCDRDYERFGESHVLAAVQALIPQVKGVQGSFFTYQEWQDPVRMLYIEVQKEDKKGFSNQEIHKLRSQLTVQVKARIERLTHSLFQFRNEEEVLRYIMALSHEVQSPDDMPQVVSTFQEQRRNTLTYNIILVRPKIEGTPPVTKLYGKLPEGVSCHLDMEQVVGKLEENVEKLANVFSLTFEKGPFLRKDNAVDLLKARQYVIEVLNGLFGEIRDYNGGLMLKQNEVLEATRVLLTPSEQASEHLLESLFYSLTPAVMQSHLQPEVVHTLFQLLLETTASELKLGQRFAMQHIQKHDCDFLFVRAEERSFKDELEQVVKDVKLESLQLASSFLTIHGSFYQGYIYFGACPETGSCFHDKVQEAMEQWAKMRRGRQTLRLNLPRFSPSLDPRIGGDRRSGILTHMLYEGLIRYNREGKPILGAAEKLNISDDFKTYIFTLRESYWSNGARLTALDFEYAWKKLLHPDFRSSYVPLYFYPIRNAIKAKNGRCSLDDVGIYVRSDDKLIIELEEPTPYFLELLSHWIFSPLYHEIDRTSPGWAHSSGESFVCNGPFKLAPCKMDEELRLVKNPLYWDSAAVRLQRIQVCMLEESQTAWEMYEQNELDWIGDPLCELPQDLIPKLESKKRLSGAIHWGWFNTERFPFTSKKMRRAFTYGVDRAALIQDGLHGHGEPAMSVIPSSMEASLGPHFKDAQKEEAKRLFEEALEQAGMTREELGPITLRYLQLPRDERIARVLAKQWSDLFGVRIVVEGTPWRLYYEKSSVSQDFHIALATWSPAINDPVTILRSFTKRSMPYNIALWENPRYAQLVQDSDCCLDPVKRKALIGEAEGILLDKMPVVPLVYPEYIYHNRPGLSEVAFYDSGLLDFKWAYISQEDS